MAAPHFHHFPIALPVWPKPLERQFQQWLPKEPWWPQELCYRAVPGSDEPRPCLPPAAWCRFFFWRYQTGYGTHLPDAILQGLVDSETRLSDCWHAARHGHLLPPDFAGARTWAHAPFYAVFQAVDVTEPTLLFHRQTLRKMRRLGLLATPEPTEE